MTSMMLAADAAGSDINVGLRFVGERAEIGDRTGNRETAWSRHLILVEMEVVMGISSNPRECQICQRLANM
jgi:hypothetical protein